MLLLLLAKTAAAAPLAVSAYIPYATQPGVKLEVRQTLREQTPTRSLYVAPQIAAFSRLGNHASASLGADLGWRFRAEGRARRASVALGTNYLMAAQVVSESIDLGTGASTKTRDLRHYYLPTLSYEAAWANDSGREIFGRASAGYKLSPQIAEGSALLALELGVRFAGGEQ